MFIDYGVSCASWEYRAGAVAAWATLALFGVAAPVFLLFKARSAALHPVVRVVSNLQWPQSGHKLQSTMCGIISS
jgi:hypothetical protein